MDTKTLILLAREAIKHAYAPYSGIQVAATLLLEDDSIVAGVNVENASYGLTICAERNAMATAISSGKNRIKAVAITSNSPQLISPCGACRQVLAEFSSPDTLVILDAGNDQEPAIYTMAELLPLPFSIY